MSEVALKVTMACEVRAVLPLGANAAAAAAATRGARWYTFLAASHAHLLLPLGPSSVVWLFPAAGSSFVSPSAPSHPRTFCCWGGGVVPELRRCGVHAGSAHKQKLLGRRNPRALPGPTTHLAASLLPFQLVYRAAWVLCAAWLRSCRA